MIEYNIHEKYLIVELVAQTNTFKGGHKNGGIRPNCAQKQKYTGFSCRNGRENQERMDLFARKHYK